MASAQETMVSKEEAKQEEGGICCAITPWKAALLGPYVPGDALREFWFDMFRADPAVLFNPVACATTGTSTSLASGSSCRSCRSS